MSRSRHAHSLGSETLADMDPRPVPSARGPVKAPRLRLQMTRMVLWVAAVASLASALLLLATVPQHEWRNELALLFVGLAGVAALCTRLPEQRLAAGLTGMLSLLTLAVAATTLSQGWGLAAPGLPIAGLMVCVLCAAAGWRAGAVLATVAALAVGGVALLTSWPGYVPTPLPSSPRTALLLGTNLLAIASGMVCGVLVSHVIQRYMRAAHEREERFRRLLALATDAYWEVDRHYRLRAVSDHSGEPRVLSLQGGLGRVPWELPQFGAEPEQLDRLQADLDARLSFRNVPVRWRSSSGRVHDYVVSGEPRFDQRGIFTGYWGVARDVSAERAAHEALAATETRYQDLFSRIPTPLVLHRSGRVLDANPAAMRLFGYATLSEMLNSDILAAYESGDSRERARRRLETLQAEPLGTALPVTDFKLVVGQRAVSVRATSVRVPTEGGPAVLAIYVDDTERLAAEEAVRRSEAMLSHLVATSPDLITLTELSTGRYVMVNKSFERISGFSAAEAVGRTALELGVWPDTISREDFVRRLSEHGSVADLPVRFRVRGGSSVQLVVSAARFAMDRHEFIVINARDVTERERQRLEREAILANASIGIAVTRNEQFVLANRHFERILGWDEGEILGRSGRVAWASDEDYAEFSRQALPALRGSALVELERTVCRKDGSSFLARVRGCAVDPSRPEESGTVWIVEDVTERRQFEQALARARDEAEAASRAKSAFLANTSHELRTPLNGMIGLARMAGDEHTSEERRRQYLDQIATSAQALAGIISDILDLSKIEAGKLQIENTVFDLGAELQKLQRSYAPLAAAHGLELRFEMTPEVEGAVQGDPLRLRQVLNNFLANAVKFTAAGHIGLAARRLDGQRQHFVRFEVSDSGPGIAEATLERLFKPFTQADQSTTRRYGGTGLGLSICRELATLMGGLVGVQSRVGEGSRFWAELPLPAAPDLPAPVVATHPEALVGKRVLMAEDNPVNMLIAVAMLERWGLQVDQAFDGREAVGAVQRAAATGKPYDAVLMDVQMPVLSGHEATRVLRQAGHKLPVIALTAAALVSEREAALASGMNDFLTKPIDAEKLQAALQQWCAPPEETVE